MQVSVFANPPEVLQIYREPLKPDRYSDYDEIERDTARIAAALGCPHPYLAAESLTGTKEVWWFNGYESANEQQRVHEAYAKNTRLMAALRENSRRKAELTLAPVEALAYYRSESSFGEPWVLGRGRFLIITVARNSGNLRGTVFETADGTQFVVISAQTRRQANRARDIVGSSAEILAVRPLWSFAAKEWIARDPGFWQTSSRR